MSLDEDGKPDSDHFAKSLEATMSDTGLVVEYMQLGGYAVMFPIFTAFGLGLYVLMKITSKKKFHRKGEEHGSARWANSKEIKSLLDKPTKEKKKKAEKVKTADVTETGGTDKVKVENVTEPVDTEKKPHKDKRSVKTRKKKQFIKDNNIILTNEVKMSLNTRQTRKNLNVMIIGGSGSGKSRFFVKPNLMQVNTSYVCTDPKGELLRSTGKMLEGYGYKIKVFNLIDMAHSNNYNPFNYIYDVEGNYSATAVIKMVNVLMKNTQKEGGGGGDQFWGATRSVLKRYGTI